MIHHFMTKYRDENDVLWCESWLQLNLFGRCYCFSKRREKINGSMRLRLKRAALGMSQSELAKRSGVHLNTINNWECGGVLNAKVGTLKKVADVLGCTIDDLLGGDENGDESDERER